MAYSLIDYGAMIRESPRRDAYIELLRRTITPRTLAVDVGAGFGFFAVLAARLGAEHVFAVEPDESIHFGKALAEENGVADRITWVQGVIQDVSLPRPADLIVSDMRGILPMLGGHFEAIATARALLATDGVLAPRSDTLWAAPVGDRAPFEAWHVPWEDAPGGVVLESVRRTATNLWGRGRVTPAQLLSPAQTWATIDYETVPQARVGGAIHVVTERAGPLSGIAAWFSTELAPGIGFSNAPGERHSIYANALFPLANVVDVPQGAHVAIEIAATPVNDDWDWQWHACATTADGQVLLDERHHSMLARPLAALVKKLPVQR